MLHYRDFTRDDFDPAEYANTIVQGAESHHRMDISTALGKLSFNVDHLNKQLRDQVATHYEDLLEQVTKLGRLERALLSVKDSSGTLKASFERVKANVKEGYKQVEAQSTELERIQQSTEILRRVRRFFSLAKRITAAISEPEDSGLSKAAITISDIEDLVSESDFSGIDAVEAEWPQIVAAKAAVIARGEALLQKGLDAQNQADVAAGLQVFHNLGQAAEQAKKVVDSKIQAMVESCKSAFDPATLGREIKASTHFQQMLQVGYPKFLRLFQDFSSRFVTASPTTGGSSGSTPEASGSDSSVLLKSLSVFETAYLRESFSRLLDPINLAFPDRPLGGIRPTPSRDDVDKILRACSRELEISKFDAMLSKAVARNVSKAINMYAVRCEQIAATDASAYPTLGVASAPASLVLNVEIVNCLWHLADGLWKLRDDFDSEDVSRTLEDATEQLHRLIFNIIEPILSHIVREVEGSILKIHSEDFLRTGSASKAPPRGGVQQQQEGGIGAYVLEVGAKLRWAMREIISKLQCGDDTKDWVQSIGVRILNFFVQQASLVRPLGGDAGKLRLTSDMTQLEFALTQWTSGVGLKMEVAMGDAYKALRAF
ncbi:Conserved oligomeric Golgi complex subunit, partial [Cladochytrium tenue]